MMNITTQCKVKLCSKCPGGTEYFCEQCELEFCYRCKESHIKDLKNICHDIVPLYGKWNRISKHEFCVKHHDNVYSKYCESCQVPVCAQCSEHKPNPILRFFLKQDEHQLMDIQEAYNTKCQEHRETISIIRCEALLCKHALLKEIKNDINDIAYPQADVLFIKSKMLKRAQKVNDLIDYVVCPLNVKKMFKATRRKNADYFARTQRYEHIYEQSAVRPVQFLLSIKTPSQPEIEKNMTELQKVNFIMKILCDFKPTKVEKRYIGTGRLLKLMYHPSLRQCRTVSDINQCDHISSTASNLLCVSHRNKLILRENIAHYQTMHCIDNLCCDLDSCGLHAISNDKELIYINRNHNIIKVSKDMKTTSKFIKKTYRKSKWKPRCLSLSSSTGDLLVGMYKNSKRKNKRVGKVTRFNETGQQTQSITNDGPGKELYRKPNYITENNNGDIIVSDYLGAVVVTERGGRHRFSYTGSPLNGRLQPRGICTDAFSHILVCDVTTKTIHLLDKDGHFLSYLEVNQPQKITPISLSYDVNTRRIWVGSLNTNKVYEYSYLTRHNDLNALEKRKRNFYVGYPGGRRLGLERICTNVLFLLNDDKTYQGYSSFNATGAANDIDANDMFLWELV